MKKIIFIFLILILSVAFYYILHTDEKQIPETVKVLQEENLDTTLNLGILNFDTLDPINSKNVYVQKLSKLIYSSLFNITDKFKAEPEIAKGINKLDELTYIISINENIKWSDGTNLNTEDIVYTINKIKENNGSIYYNFVKNIKNAKKIDEYTLKLELYELRGFIEYDLVFPIMNEDPLIGSGSYKVVKNDEEILLEKNNSGIEKIAIKKYSEISQMYNDFKNDKLDMLVAKNSDYTNILGEIGFCIKEYNGREYTYIDFNVKKMDLPEVREAIYYAMNKSEIISKVFSNKYKEAEFILDSSNWLYRSSSTHKYNIEKSIRVLEDNGWAYKNNNWSKGSKTLKFKLLLDSLDETKNEIAYIFKNQMKKIGIDIEIDKVSTKIYNNYVGKKDYDIIIKTENIELRPDISKYFINNQEAQNLFNEINYLTNDREKIEKYKNIEEFYEENYPFIVIGCNKETLIYSSNLYGSISPNWYNFYYNIETWKKIYKNT